jgi:hypothetical protein
MNISRSNYRTEKEYRAALKDAARDYPYKVKVVGGYRFFRSAQDLRTWRNQR